MIQRSNRTMSTGHWLMLDENKTPSLSVQILSMVVVCTVTIPLLLLVTLGAGATQAYTKIKQSIDL
jgi:hypothetical protein